MEDVRVQVLLHSIPCVFRRAGTPDDMEFILGCIRNAICERTVSKELQRLLLEAIGPLCKFSVGAFSVDELRSSIFNLVHEFGHHKHFIPAAAARPKTVVEVKYIASQLGQPGSINTVEVHNSFDVEVSLRSSDDDFSPVISPFSIPSPSTPGPSPRRPIQSAHHGDGGEYVQEGQCQLHLCGQTLPPSQAPLPHPFPPQHHYLPPVPPVPYLIPTDAQTLKTNPALPTYRQPESCTVQQQKLLSHQPVHTKLPPRIIQLPPPISNPASTHFHPLPPAAPALPHLPHSPPLHFPALAPFPPLCHPALSQLPHSPLHSPALASFPAVPPPTPASAHSPHNPPLHSHSQASARFPHNPPMHRNHHSVQAKSAYNKN